MGGGGPLAFLNKKPWHPQRVQNLEEVWKREQKAAAEQKKLEELRQQYEEERKNQEFLDIARSAGHGQSTDRLDWMYAGGLAAKEDAAKRQEEALLGKRPAQLDAADKEADRCEQASNLASTQAGAPPPTSQNEQWQRLNNDPLLMIKRQQQEQLKKIKDNPIKMQQILKQVQEQQGKSKDKKHKKDKKKHKKSRKHRGSGSSSSDSDSAADERRPSENGLSKREGSHALHAPGLGRGGPAGGGYVRQPERQQQSGSHLHRSRSRSRSPRRGSSQQYHRRDEPRDVHVSRDSRPAGRDGYSGGSGRDRERDREGDRHRHERVSHQDSRGPGRGARDDGRRDDRGRRDEGRPRSRSRSQERRRDGGARETRDHHHGRDRDSEQAHHRSVKEHRHGDGEVAVARTEASHQSRPELAGGLQKPDRPGYGLSHSSVAPEAVLRYDTSSRAAETRERLKEAARKKEEEERRLATQRQQVQQHKTGRLTEEERAKRLAEMTSNAAQHDAGRLDRLARAAKEDVDTGVGVSNANGVAGSIREGDAFLKAASRDVYGALDGANLEARVNSRKHFAQR